MPRLRLLIDDVTPSVAPAQPGPEPLAGQAPGQVEPELGPDDVPLYVGLARGIDWGIGALLGPDKRATDRRVDDVGEAIAPIGRRLEGLVGASGVVDAAVPSLVRELATLAAAVYVAWGDAFEQIFREQVAARRARREETDGDLADRSTRAGDRGAARGARPAGRLGGPAEAAGGAADAGQEIRPPGPPGPRSGRSAELGGAFALGSALGSGAG